MLCFKGYFLAIIFFHFVLIYNKASQVIVKIYVTNQSTSTIEFQN